MSPTPKLIEEGRRAWDRAQANLSWQVSRSDADILSDPAHLAEVFCSGANDPEEYRAYSRRAQDMLDRKGREVFAAEYAEEKSRNL